MAQESRPRVEAIDVAERSVSELLGAMGRTAYQGRTLAEAAQIWSEMLAQPDLTIVLGLAGSMSTAGQWKMINWLIESRFVDVVVSTGANVSEDVVEAMGATYWQGSAHADDRALLADDLNRYYDVLGKETDYRAMEDLITEFLVSLPEASILSSMELLHLFGTWLGNRNVNSIAAVAARHQVPVFAPALLDSAYGEAVLMAQNRGRALVVDQAREFTQFVSIAEHAKHIGVIYLGGGVPKDFTQLLAISVSPKTNDEPVAGREGTRRKALKEYYYPHRYAIQITADAPQWGGLSGCTLDEAISWGKVAAEGRYVTCYCDVTIALPLLTHSLRERVAARRATPDLRWLFDDILRRAGS